MATDVKAAKRFLSTIARRLNSLGAITRGHAVRFRAADDLLAAGEGIETMLSLRLALPTMAVAAALSEGHLAAVLLPPTLRRLYIARDVDAAGDRALAATDPSVAFHHGEIEGRLLDLADRRLALMDETGVDVQVLSLTTPALHDLGPDSIGLARRTNDALAEAVARHPTRFQAMATLPVSMPDGAAQELERCMRTLGFEATMLCGRVGAHNLDHPSLATIFETAAACGAPVLLHPRVPDMAVRKAYYSGFAPEVDAAFACFGLGWHYDAGIQFLRLVLSGLFDRLPGLQVNLGHWGELVLFYTERFAALDRFSGLAHPVATSLRRNLFVTGSDTSCPNTCGARRQS